MAAEIPGEALQLRSLVRAENMLELFLDTVPVAAPGPSEVLIRVEAAPVNPSDLGLLLAGADVAAARAAGTPQRPVITAPIPDAAMRGLTARVGTPMPAGNEGAGTVVAAGSGDAARRLLGKKVAAAGGAMYSQYCIVDASLCLELPEGVSAADGASAFVNPMTALGMVETMRMENHVALVHTAAASNLGQMLNRLCQQEQVPLVNIVRRPEQEELLRAAGAVFVSIVPARWHYQQCRATPNHASAVPDTEEATSSNLVPPHQISPGQALAGRPPVPAPLSAE